MRIKIINHPKNVESVKVFWRSAGAADDIEQVEFAWQIGAVLALLSFFLLVLLFLHFLISPFSPFHFFTFSPSFSFCVFLMFLSPPFLLPCFSTFLSFFYFSFFPFGAVAQCGVLSTSVLGRSAFSSSTRPRCDVAAQSGLRIKGSYNSAAPLCIHCAGVSSHGACSHLMLHSLLMLNGDGRRVRTSMQEMVSWANTVVHLNVYI